MKPANSTKNAHASFNLWPLFREAVLICLVGAALGLGVNHTLVLEVLHGREGRVVAPHQDSGGALVLPAARAEVVQLLKAGAVLVDARAPELFAEGHLAGAFSLPVGDLDTVLPSFIKKVSPETPLVVYCSGYGCPDSEDVAARLVGAGFDNVRVYEGGFPEWKDAGLPVETGRAP